MVIIETSMFTKKIRTLLNDEEYRALQNILVEMPSSGKIFKAVVGFAKFAGVPAVEGREVGHALSIIGQLLRPNLYALRLCKK